MRGPSMITKGRKGEGFSNWAVILLRGSVGNFSNVVKEEVAGHVHRPCVAHEREWGVKDEAEEILAQVLHLYPAYCFSALCGEGWLAGFLSFPSLSCGCHMFSKKDTWLALCGIHNRCPGIKRASTAKPLLHTSPALLSFLSFQCQGSCWRRSATIPKKTLSQFQTTPMVNSPLFPLNCE